MIHNPVIIFGGSFNPPHQGHFIIIKKVLKETGLKKIILMPSAIQPLKSNYDMAPIKNRLAMVRILAKLDPRIEVSDMEVRRTHLGKKSYTIETIKEIKKKYPQTEIYWVIGQDSLKEILDGKWKGGLKIFDKVNFIVTTRDSLSFKFKIPKNILAKIKIIKMKCPVSSTIIRKLLRQGKSVSKLLPKEILKYIKNKKLYASSFPQKMRKEKLEKEIEDLALNLVKRLKQKKLKISAMESCTGGTFMNALTNIQGSSEITKGGRTTYSNEEKIANGISLKIIKKYSVYSPEVSRLMAKKITQIIRGTDLGVGITGIFLNPDPASKIFIPGRADVSIFYKQKFLSRRYLLPLPKTNQKNPRFLSHYRIFLKSLIVREALKLCLEIIK